MISGSYVAVSFISYSIPLFLLTGYLILQFDIKEYRFKKMEKERKLSKVLGWTNLGLGTALLIMDYFIL
ncbi:CLC_0170 family protein [Paenibacillus sp. OV219]|uniref:CLC_0170 family protein n=1 Tax=Paenibacillus sp. OV219 TaxID=1884377 RepID=UPI0008D60419|nr:CLC_0170 family protein [Paenibacillus sp. OV219]SEP14945.1 hypothetical protein SAMN05518847_12018 [Paenibacillus sp. OV219]